MQFMELVRVQTNVDKKFKLMLSDELQPEHKQLECNRPFLQCLLNDCLGIIAKEHFFTQSITVFIKSSSLIFGYFRNN